MFATAGAYQVAANPSWQISRLIQTVYAASGDSCNTLEALFLDCGWWSLTSWMEVIIVFLITFGVGKWIVDAANEFLLTVQFIKECSGPGTFDAELLGGSTPPKVESGPTGFAASNVISINRRTDTR